MESISVQIRGPDAGTALLSWPSHALGYTPASLDVSVSTLRRSAVLAEVLSRMTSSGETSCSFEAPRDYLRAWLRMVQPAEHTDTQDTAREERCAQKFTCMMAADYFMDDDNVRDQAKTVAEFVTTAIANHNLAQSQKPESGTSLSEQLEALPAHLCMKVVMHMPLSLEVCLTQAPSCLHAAAVAHHMPSIAASHHLPLHVCDLGPRATAVLLNHLRESPKVAELKSIEVSGMFLCHKDDGSPPSPPEKRSRHDDSAVASTSSNVSGEVTTDASECVTTTHALHRLLLRATALESLSITGSRATWSALLYTVYATKCIRGLRTLRLIPVIHNCWSGLGHGSPDAAPASHTGDPRHLEMLSGHASLTHLALSMCQQAARRPAVLEGLARAAWKVPLLQELRITGGHLGAQSAAEIMAGASQVTRLHLGACLKYEHLWLQNLTKLESLHLTGEDAMAAPQPTHTAVLPRVGAGTSHFSAREAAGRLVIGNVGSGVRGMPPTSSQPSPALHHMQNLRNLQVEYTSGERCEPWVPSRLAACGALQRSLTSLTLKGTPFVTDPATKQGVLYVCEDDDLREKAYWSHIRSLTKLTSLQQLKLHSCPWVGQCMVTFSAVLGHLHALRHLDVLFAWHRNPRVVSYVNRGALPGLAALSRLTHVRFGFDGYLDGTSWTSRDHYSGSIIVPSVTAEICRYMGRLTALQNLQHLETLPLCCRAYTDAAPTMDLMSRSLLRWLRPVISDLPALKTLRLQVNYHPWNAEFLAAVAAASYISRLVLDTTWHQQPGDHGDLNAAMAALSGLAHLELQVAFSRDIDVTSDPLDVSVRGLWGVLPKLTNLEALQLRGVFHSTGVDELSPLVASASNLRRLTRLRINADAPPLHHAVPQSAILLVELMPCLKHLVLTNCLLDTAGANRLAQALLETGRNRLEHLCICSNPAIGDEGACVLAAAISEQRHLRVLETTCIGTTRQGDQMLEDACCMHARLEFLQTGHFDLLNSQERAFECKCRK